MNLLVGQREPKSTGDASHLERCGVINFIHMCFPQMAGILQLLDFGCRTNMTNIYIYECCSIANDALYLPCVVSLTNSKNDVCTRTHTENFEGSCPFSIQFIYIFCCFLLSNSSNCCSRGTIFGAGALRLHPTKENTREHLTKQGLCWREDLIQCRKQMTSLRFSCYDLKFTRCTCCGCTCQLGDGSKLDLEGLREGPLRSAACLGSLG